MTHSDTLDDPVARATALQPLVRDHADEAERDRRLPAPVARAMAEAGLYRVAASARLGGGEHDPATQVRTIEAISEADGATGWNLMIGIETFGLLTAGFARAAELFADPLAIPAGSTASFGRADVTDGGYRLSGQWPFVSGCHNATWFSGLSIVHEGGAPRQGTPPRFMLVPRESIEILDTWHVAGLRGSGSHDVRVDDVFVAEQDTVGFGTRASGGADTVPPAARVPLGARLAYNKVGVALGIARGALDAFGELAAGKVPRFTSTTLRERPFAQRAIAQGEARLRGARAFVFESLDELWQAVREGRELDARARALLQIACSDAVRACAEAVDQVVEAAGTSANPLDSPLERRARDVRVVRQHTTVAPHHIEDGGRVLLGLPAQGMMLSSLA